MSPSSLRPRKYQMAEEEDEELWTVYSARVCLASLLHDPASGPRAHADIFTQTWGEDFTPATEVPPSAILPNIGRHDLIKQLKRISKVN